MITLARLATLKREARLQGGGGTMCIFGCEVQELVDHGEALAIEQVRSHLFAQGVLSAAESTSLDVATNAAELVSALYSVLRSRK